MKRTAICLLGVCAALVLVTTARGRGLGTLAGTVVNAKGEPVAGASVIMQSATGRAPRATTTNSHGRFFFAELGGGYYDVRATSGSKASAWKHNLEVRTGRQTDIVLRLDVPIRKKR